MSLIQLDDNWWIFDVSDVFGNLSPGADPAQLWRGILKELILICMIVPDGVGVDRAGGGDVDFHVRRTDGVSGLPLQ